MKRTVSIVAAAVLTLGGLAVAPSTAQAACRYEAGCPRPPHPGHKWDRQPARGKLVAIDVRAARHVAGPVDPRVAVR